MTTKKTDLKKLSYSELEKLVIDLDLPKFKARIIWDWIYKKNAGSFAVMSNLSKLDRQLLEDKTCLLNHTIEARQVSSDGTIKYLFGLHDSKCVESVYIPTAKHNTLCVSSQVGCSLDCKFCATGALGVKRNLHWSEIVEQVLAVRREGLDIEYVVFMGMGEPLLNYDNVLAAVRLINGADAIGLGIRRITISTAGIIPGIIKLGTDVPGIGLAVSLNATTNHQRSELMPINIKYPIKKVIEAADQYQEKSGRRVSFEYVMLDGINDTDKDADNLIKLIRDLICHVNLIQYNNSEQLYTASRNTDAFYQKLYRAKIEVTRRKSSGGDIAAACGQLAGKHPQE